VLVFVAGEADRDLGRRGLALLRWGTLGEGRHDQLCLSMGLPAALVPCFASHLPATGDLVEALAAVSDRSCRSRARFFLNCERPKHIKASRKQPINTANG
jgi:hypothetical protein